MSSFFPINVLLPLPQANRAYYTPKQTDSPTEYANPTTDSVYSESGHTKVAPEVTTRETQGEWPQVNTKSTRASVLSSRDEGCVVAADNTHFVDFDDITLCVTRRRVDFSFVSGFCYSLFAEALFWRCFNRVNFEL